MASLSVSKKLAQPAALPAIIFAAALMLTVGPSAALRIVDRAIRQRLTGWARSLLKSK